MNAKRGFVPEDERNFSLPALENMKTASRHVCYLLNEGYDLKQAVTFVGNHYLLSERQRLAVMRSVATQTQIENRKEKQVPLTSLSGREVWIDGFNTIITLREAGVSRVNILLDQPVSNSGRLKTCMADLGEEYPFILDIRILRDVDRELYGKENVITSDSIILDHCISWVNLTPECLKLQGKDTIQVW